MNIWRVDFDYVFSSSSGMTDYKIPHQRTGELLATTAVSIPQLEETIQAKLGPQYEGVKILHAEWFGRSWN